MSKHTILGLSLLLASAGVFAADAAPAASPADDKALQDCIAAAKPMTDADKQKAKDDCVAKMQAPKAEDTSK